ncbi:MAG: hypothetical protein ACRECV_01045 [Xanthobacteraceae bacterium]
MKHLTAAVVCLVVLYAVDSFFCDGWYFGAAAQAAAQAYALVW